MANNGPNENVEPFATDVARRQMIKSALAAVPVVLTITAGTARAQGASMYSDAAPAPGPEPPDEPEEP